jgi:hypothetical protein
MTEWMLEGVATDAAIPVAVVVLVLTWMIGYLMGHKRGLGIRKSVRKWIWEDYEAQLRNRNGSVRAFLIEMTNADTGVLRPLVEEYRDDGTGTHRSFATRREWAVARKVSGWFQDRSYAALKVLGVDEEDS